MCCDLAAAFWERLASLGLRTSLALIFLAIFDLLGLGYMAGRA
jgi:hypothetical protein